MLALHELAILQTSKTASVTQRPLMAFLCYVQRQPRQTVLELQQVNTAFCTVDTGCPHSPEQNSRVTDSACLQSVR